MLSGKFESVMHTVLFPCGVVHVASRLLSKLVGLYDRVI